MSAEQEIVAQELQRQRILEFHTPYLDKAFRPETMPDFLASYRALRTYQIARTRQDNIPQLLTEINAIALNERLPSLAHLAGVRALGAIMNSPNAQEFASAIVDVQNNFATLGVRMHAIDPALFGTNRDTRHYAALVMAELANIMPREAETDDTINPQMQLQRDTLRELLSRTELQLRFPRMTTVSINANEEYPLGNPSLPYDRMINSRGRLARWGRMGDAVYWGVPNRVGGTTYFDLRLPAAQISLEHERRTITYQGSTQRSSNMDHVRMPAIERPHESPQALFGRKEFNQGQLLSAHLINSLTLYGAKKMLRSLRRALNRQDAPGELISQQLLEDHARRIVGRFTAPVSHNGQQHPSIFERALEEHHNSIYGDEWNLQEAAESMVYSLMCIGATYQPRVQRYRLRSEDEIDQLAVEQTVRDLPFSKLVELADIFKRLGTRESLTPEQSQHVDSTEMATLVENIFDAFRRNPTEAETSINTTYLQTYLEQVLQVRYETIRRRTVDGQPPGVEDEDEE